MIKLKLGDSHDVVGYRAIIHSCECSFGYMVLHGHLLSPSLPMQVCLLINPIHKVSRMSITCLSAHCSLTHGILCYITPSFPFCLLFCPRRSAFPAACPS